MTTSNTKQWGESIISKHISLYYKIQMLSNAIHKQIVGDNAFMMPTFKVPEPLSYNPKEGF